MGWSSRVKVKKDRPQCFSNGEKVGDGSPPQTDIAVDPIDGTTLTSLGRGNALAVISVSPRGTMFDPGPCVYMEKIAAGPDCHGTIDITRSATENLQAIAEAKRESVRDITAVILDRDRHHDLINEVRTAGARIRLIPDGDVAGRYQPRGLIQEQMFCSELEALRKELFLLAFEMYGRSDARSSLAA